MNKKILPLSFLAVALLFGQASWSAASKLYCQGLYETGELLQIVIDIDIKKRQIITADKVSPIGLDDFNVIWASEANGVQFESILNRWTGELSATMIQNNEVKPNFLRGLCETIDKTKF